MNPFYQEIKKLKQQTIEEFPTKNGKTGMYVNLRPIRKFCTERGLSMDYIIEKVFGEPENKKQCVRTITK